ncbi:MAG: Sec-independent protein translocase protein TatB [Acidobacteriota bacterium]|jgi:Tat protein translocase TatB subunit|nr:Sec-independent protein translocase protein TatB [Acidobacteriota bacterium]
MFGSLGFQEIILIFVVVLLVFGPDKLPRFARELGKFIRDFRSTVNEAKHTIQEEVDRHDVTRDIRELDSELKKLQENDQDETKKSG